MNAAQIKHEVNCIRNSIDDLEAHLLDKGELTDREIGHEGKLIMDDIYDLVDTVIKGWGAC